jgi:hypothetical protein
MILCLVAGDVREKKGRGSSRVQVLLGSLGVIAAALIIMYSNWTLADPIIGAGIGLYLIAIFANSVANHGYASTRPKTAS